MTTLRDGSITEDARLDLIFEKDERSRSYAAVDVLKADQETPRYRAYSVNRWLDQGPDGACVGFAFTHELCSTPLRIKQWREIKENFAWDVYHRAQHIDPWHGCSLGPNCPIEANDESYEGTSMLAGIKTVQQDGYIDEYRWAFGEEDLALAVSHLGPAVIGVRWYEGMFQPNRHNFIEPTGNVSGGHAVVVNSINPNFENEGLQYYRIWNSWGASWARNGWAYISREHMKKLLGEQGEAVIPLIRNEEA